MTMLVVPNNYSAQVHLPEIYLIEWMARFSGADIGRLRSESYLKKCIYTVYTFRRYPDVLWDSRQHLFVQGHPLHGSVLLRSRFFFQWLRRRMKAAKNELQIVSVESIMKTARPEFTLYQNIYPFWLRYHMIRGPVESTNVRKNLSAHLLATYGSDLSEMRLGNLPKTLFTDVVDHYASKLHGFCLVIPPDVQAPTFNPDANVIVTSADKIVQYAGVDYLLVPQSSFITSMVSHDFLGLAGHGATEQTMVEAGSDDWSLDEEDSDEELETRMHPKFAKPEPYVYLQKDIKKVPSYANTPKHSVACDGANLAIKADLINMICIQSAITQGSLCVVQIEKPALRAEVASLLAVLPLPTLQTGSDLSSPSDETLAIHLQTDRVSSNLYLCLCTIEPMPPERSIIPCSGLLFLGHLYTYYATEFAV
jgi:hypothetical protein